MNILECSETVYSAVLRCRKLLRLISLNVQGLSCIFHLSCQCLGRSLIPTTMDVFTIIIDITIAIFIATNTIISWLLFLQANSEGTCIKKGARSLDQPFLRPSPQSAPPLALEPNPEHSVCRAANSRAMPLVLICFTDCIFLPRL